MTLPLVIECKDVSEQLNIMSYIVKSMRDGYNYCIYNTIKCRSVSLHKTLSTAKNFLELNKGVKHYRIIKLSTIICKVRKK